MPTRKPGPRSVLLIAAEAPTHPLYPGNGVFAIVQARITGTGAKSQCLITSPKKVAASFEEEQPLFFGENPTLPTWHQVRAAYAGKPREIDLSTYIAIWRERWFRQGGFSYRADRALTLRTGATASMEAVWKHFLHLRDLTLRTDTESTHTLDALMRAASGKFMYDPARLAALRTASPNFARLALHADNTFNKEVAGILLALAEFDVAARAFEPAVTLVTPWHTRKR
ncbi:MAG TPA: hypothetical protein VLA88_05330 [Candidatus Saccharimonadales bacterium]|nr:hypothetical protein [Candidatus Saccharimonadales bacterium]